MKQIARSVDLVSDRVRILLDCFQYQEQLAGKGVVPLSRRFAFVFK
jgi:hypothetical protein